jgi:hypothetical protein
MGGTASPGRGNSEKIAVVGLPDTAVKESKDRVISAICNSALRWPSRQRITINLALADVRKEGPSFDLPIALGLLKVEGDNRLPDLEPFCLTGELALSGRLRPVKGVLSIALEARRRNRRTLIVPIQNAEEAAVVEGLDVYGIGSLSDVVKFLRGEFVPEPVRSSNGWSKVPVSGILFLTQVPGFRSVIFRTTRSRIRWRFPSHWIWELVQLIVSTTLGRACGTAAQKTFVDTQL